MLEPDYEGMTVSKRQAMRCFQSHQMAEVLDCGDHITVVGEYVCNGTTGTDLTIFRPNETGHYSVQQIRDYLGY